MVRELKGIIDKQMSHLRRPWAKKRACCIRPVFYAEDWRIYILETNNWMLNTFIGAPGMIRTYDTRIRNPVLYPLSYGGIFLLIGCWRGIKRLCCYFDTVSNTVKKYQIVTFSRYKSVTSRTVLPLIQRRQIDSLKTPYFQVKRSKDGSNFSPRTTQKHNYTGSVCRRVPVNYMQGQSMTCADPGRTFLSSTYCAR